MPAKPARRYTLFHEKRKQIPHIVWHAATGDWVKLPEVLHHIDGNRFNNELGNLQLMTRIEHSSLHNSGASHGSWKGDSAIPRSKYLRVWRARKKLERRE